jgi:hypothetical protein
MPKVPSEVILEQYQLRSTFFAEKLEEFGFHGFAERVDEVIAEKGDAISWTDKHANGISDEAWEMVEASDVHPLMVFCHAEIIRTYPELLRYYRSISLLPQKGLQSIAKVSNIKDIESDGVSIAANKIGGTVKTLNELMSSTIVLSSGISKHKINAMMYATAGTTIDGSWRNQIGAEGERVVRSVLLKSLQENDEIAALIDSKDKSYSVDEWADEYGELLSTIPGIKRVETTNGSSLLFSSEPDVTFVDSSGRTVGAMEIKAGIDPAGALERLGAMFKSFDSVLAVTPGATTILVATCITDEVASRLRESNTVKKTYLTTDVISNRSGTATRLANAVRAELGLIDKRL